MLRKVIHTIKANNMVKAGDNIICALSGGADSMALLYVLYEAREELGISLYAAHLNHGIRGEEADGDCVAAKRFCEKIGVELFVKNVDIPRLAKEQGIGEEECGRNERYFFFDEIKERLHGGRIATGHHMNDNAETVLFNLFRGSGGLKGIPYVRGDVIRPLRDVSRREIEEYLRKNNISWREDSTNKENKYTRNYIRNVIIKEIEEQFPSAIYKIAQSAEISERDSEYLDLLAMESGAFENGAIIFEKFIPLHESLKRRVVILALKAWGVQNINSQIISAVYETVTGPTGNKRDIGNNLIVYKSYSFIMCEQSGKILKDKNEHFIKIDENLEITVSDGIWSVKSVDKKEKMRDNKRIVVLDADKLGEGVSLRKRMDGDYIYPKGMDGRKKLKEIFINMKIPVKKRDEITLLAKGSEILFIPGIRSTGKYQPDENTKLYFIAEFIPDIKGGK